MITDMIDATIVGDSSHGGFQSISGIVAHFEDRKSELAAVGLETDELDTIVAYIDSARDNAIERFLLK